METLIQFITGLGSLLSSLTGNMPNDKKIDRNIELLKADSWFADILSENRDFISEDKNIRYIIGKANIKRILKDPKRKMKFQTKIDEALPQK